jgi:hypothetical protein
MKCILAAALASLILLATPALGEPIAPVSLVASNDCASRTLDFT